jgi:heterotetrameric sarcosine oxidase gamma subunit
MSADRASLRDCVLTRMPATAVVEFVAFTYPLEGAMGVEWPAAPGAACHDGAGRPTRLHLAPGRWLLPAPDRATLALVEAATLAGLGAGTEVTGKWQGFELSGQGATRLLASTLDVAAVLEGRDGAAVTLFDCPAVLARIPDGYAIWVRASYVSDFVAAVDGLRSRA